jgi:hypothetical protein
MTYGAGASAAAYAAMVQAVKASGVIVRVEPDAFLKILGKNHDALVVVTGSSFWSKGYQYLTSYKGLAFYSKSPVELQLPSGVEVVWAKSIWVPG